MSLRIAVTPGEPGGIGPDLVLSIAQRPWPCELVVIGDPDVLAARARSLKLDIDLYDVDYGRSALPHEPGRLAVDAVACPATVSPGILDIDNAGFVLATLERAVERCRAGQTAGLVTGPVHKGIINQSGRPFTGHTEYLAELCRAPPPVMMLTTATGDMRVALATVHLPLASVSQRLGFDHLCHVFRTTATTLERYFLGRPARLLVAGLNPHAGEQGYLGREEIDVITPAIEHERAAGHDIEGPYPADTLFIDDKRRAGDVVVAMYHDQGLPVIKYAGFGQVVNVSLGLPIVRTSVDHGTALDLAATGRADASSLAAAIGVAMDMLDNDAAT